ncbi:MAG: hypothetical protein ACM3XM_13170 [Mycobacterium leprae]
MWLSIFRLPSVASLEEAAAIIHRHARLDRPVADALWPAGDLLRIGFSRVEPELPMTIQEHLPDGEAPLPYLFVHARAERPKGRRFWCTAGAELRSHEERVHLAETDLLFLDRSGALHVVLFTQSKAAIAILKGELFLPQWWGDLQEATDYHVDPDFFYWLIRTRMEREGRVGPELVVQEVSGFDGHTATDVHRMKGKGDRIYEMLSTMGFLFANDPLDALTLEVLHGTESLTFHYNRAGGAALSELQYRGRYVGGAIGERRKAAIVAYLYLKLLPELLQQHAAASRDWTPAVRSTFVRRVGREMVYRIAQQLGWDRRRQLAELLDEATEADQA